MTRSKIIDDYFKKHALGFFFGVFLFLVWRLHLPEELVAVVFIVLVTVYGFLAFTDKNSFWYSVPWVFKGWFTIVFLFKLFGQILLAVFYIPVTIYKLLTFRKPPQP